MRSINIILPENNRHYGVNIKHLRPDEIECLKSLAKHLIENNPETIIIFKQKKANKDGETARIDLRIINNNYDITIQNIHYLNPAGNNRTDVIQGIVEKVDNLLSHLIRDYNPNAGYSLKTAIIWDWNAMFFSDLLRQAIRQVVLKK